ncbi:hypothetical protein [Candidatus Pelagibacter sp. Uisw_113]|uniref:hypothetical protein n=1 Tax=Candidatus Pelagibacter sp. Uisw_113 TaxID=3230994 RepID=UPI0039EA6864
MIKNITNNIIIENFRYIFLNRLINKNNAANKVLLVNVSIKAIKAKIIIKNLFWIRKKFNANKKKPDKYAIL